MPFFSRTPEPEPEPEPEHIEEERPKRHGLFGSIKRDPSPTPSAATSATNGTRFTSTTAHTTTPATHDGGLFRRSTDAGSSRRSLLHRSFGHGNDESDMDPSIIQARERVMGAETAERDADRALDNARREVREARDQVRKLELEAKEEARRAKIKQYHAREVSKRGKALGRTFSLSPSYIHIPSS